MPPRAGATAWDVLGMGACSVDLVTTLPGLPSPQGPSSKMRMHGQMLCYGGQVATALATCARFGLRAKFVGAVGSDSNGTRMRSALAAHAVDCADAVVRDAANQHALILIDEASGERMVLWDRARELALAATEVRVDLVASTRLVHVDDVDQEAAIRLASAARDAGVPVTSDLDRLTERTEELFTAVSIPILAEHVPPALTGHDDQETALRALRARHDGLLIVTLGPGGVMALDGDRFVHVPAFRVPVADTTGAGDVFRGGFIYGLLRDWPLERTLRFANAAAAVSCTRLGALNGVPQLDEVMQLLEHNSLPVNQP